MVSTEKTYVVDFYNNNVKLFDDTRYAPWPVVKTYIDSLDSHSCVGDFGCGNGKNQYRKDLFYVSCDNSLEMCKLVSNCKNACVTNLPFENNHFDAVLCIAVIHHLSSDERRLAALNEIFRVLKQYGTAMISVWGNQFKYGQGDQIIGWNNKTNQRYIHFFSKQEIIQLVSSVFVNFRIIENYNNYFAIVTK